MAYGWNFNSDSWKLIPADLKNSQSWQAVSYSEIEAESIPKDKPGIYIFCTSPVGKRLPTRVNRNDLFSNLHIPIYVGRTNNLRRRFLEHCKHPPPSITEARRCFGPSMLFWFHRRSEDQIYDDEAILIHCFDPAANERKETIKAIVGESIPIGIHGRMTK